MNRTASQSAYRWVMVLLLAFPQIAVNCSQFQLSAFASDFMRDFGIELTSFSAVVFSYSLMTGAMAAFGGALEDRFGVYKVLVISGCVSSAASVVRLFSTNYEVFFVMSVLIGSVQGTGAAAMAKVVNKWFRVRERSLAMSIACSGGAVGVVAAQLISPVFPDYHTALVFSVILTVTATLLWLFLGRSENTRDDSGSSGSVFAYLKNVIRSRNVWLISFAASGFALLIFGTSNLLPQVLTGTRGMTESEAVFATGMLNLGAIPGAFILPLVQKKMGRYKPILAAVLIICAASFFAIMYSGNRIIPILVFVIGFFGGILIAFFFAILAGLPDIDSNSYASANGVAVMVEYYIGNFVIATFVLTPLVERNSGVLYVFMIAVCILMLVFAMLLPETEK